MLELSRINRLRQFAYDFCDTTQLPNNSDSDIPAGAYFVSGEVWPSCYGAERGVPGRFLREGPCRRPSDLPWTQQYALDVTFYSRHGQTATWRGEALCGGDIAPRPHLPTCPRLQNSMVRERRERPHRHREKTVQILPLRDCRPQCDHKDQSAT